MAILLRVAFLACVLTTCHAAEDHISVFCDKIHSQFPDAQLNMKGSSPTEAMKAAPEMVIMINSNLIAVPDEEEVKRRFKGRDVRKELKAFTDTNFVSSFKFEKPLSDSGGNVVPICGANLVESWWDPGGAGPAGTNLVVQTWSKSGA